MRLGETFPNVSVHGRRSIPVSANGEGTLLKVFEYLREDADYENLNIDSTVVKARQSSARAKKGRKIQK